MSAKPDWTLQQRIEHLASFGYALNDACAYASSPNDGRVVFEIGRAVMALLDDRLAELERLKTTIREETGP